MPPTEYIYVGRHADDLASGAPIGPGERVKASALDLEGDHDRRLVDEGLLIDANPQPQELSGEELQQRARDLNIEGRSEMSAPDLRKAVARAEREAKK